MQELRGKLLGEAEGAAAANATISSRWAGVLSLNVPQDMFHAIEQQRLACEVVMASKDQLIAGVYWLCADGAVLHSVLQLDGGRASRGAQK
jgi:hypothetical protein